MDAKERIARRVACEIKTGMLVNLGIGLPSMLAAPGTADTKPPPASVRCGSSMPSGGREPRPITPFSA